MNRILGLLTLTLASASVAQAQSSIGDESAGASLLGFYPTAALAGGVSGEATLLCERTEHGALVACRVGEEQPSGQGFGAAALALAAKSADGCGPLPPTARVSRPIRFTFRASPAAISPDPRQTGWILNLPEWKRTPASDQFLHIYPERAAHDHVEGQAVIQCVVGADGRMSECQAIAESRHDYGFGKAALALTPLFVVGAHTCGGHFAGGTIDILINFQLPS